MMNGMTDEMKAMLASGELPAKVSQRMLLAMLLDISGKLDESIKQNQEAHRCFLESVKIQVDYPSLTWLFAHKPAKTAGAILLIFAVLMAVYSAGILKVFGLMVGVNLP
jgi:hypothetical protein